MNSSNDNSRSMLSRVNDICEDFQQQWSEETRPHLSTFLQGLSDRERQLVFSHLIELEIDFRRQAGEDPSIDEYVSEFPEFSNIIAEKLPSDSTAIYNRTMLETQVYGETVKTNPTRFSPGSQLAGYLVIETIGRGGMGIVYKARQRALNRIVALKTIKPGAANDDEFVKRFRAEAEAVAKLDHEGIVPVFDVGEENNVHYLSMGFVDGASLAEKLKSGPFDCEAAATTTREIALAMQHAHDSGLIHRDLKPANVLIDTEGRAKVTDFGLAKIEQSNHDLTVSGQVMGTPSYMPPEQAKGEQGLSSSADIYAIGAILYHLLTGRPPFQSAALVETLRQVINDDPIAPRTLNPEIDQDVEAICLKCLQKSPARRYASASELADDLDRYLSGRPIAARSLTRVERTWRWCKRQPIVASLVAAVAISLVLGTGMSTYYGMLAADKATEATNNMTIASKERDLANEREKLARDRLVAAYVQSGWDAYDANDPAAALLWHAEALNVELGEKSEPDSDNPKESAKGDTVEISRVELNHRIRIAQVLRQTPIPPIVLAHDDAVVTLDYSPDGQWIVTGSRDNTARIWDTTNGKPIIDPIQHDDRVELVRFSPQSDRIATVSQGTLRVWDAKTGSPVTKPMNHPKPITQIDFHPDGNLIATSCYDRFIRIFDIEKSELVGDPWNYSEMARYSAYCVRFHDKGKKITAGGAVSRVNTWQVSNREQIGPTLTTDAQGEEIEFSPDESRLIVTGRPGNVSLFNYTTGEKIKTIKASTFGSFSTNQFSPDGTSFVTTYQADLNARIWNADDGTLLATTGKHKQGITHAVFSPDSLFVATSSYDGTVQLWSATNGESASPALIHDDTVNRLEFRADGQQLASASESGFVRLWRIEKKLPSVRVIKVADDKEDFGKAKRFQYTADNKKLMIETDKQKFLLIDLKTGKQLIPTIHFQDPIKTWEVSATANRLLVIKDQNPGVNTSGGTPFVFDLTADPVTFKPFLIDGDERNVYFISMSIDGEKILFGGYGLYDSKTLNKIVNFETEQGLEAVGLNNAGNRVALLGSTRRYSNGELKRYDGIMSIADTKSGKNVLTDLVYCKKDDLMGSSYTGKAIFSHDDKLLLTRGECGRVRIWDASTGKLIHLFNQTGWVPRHCEFDTSAKRLLVSNTRDRVRIFNVEDMTPVSRTIRLHRPHRASISADGRQFSIHTLPPSSRWDREFKMGIARVWDSSNGRPVTPNLYQSPIADHTKFATFSPDGKVFTAITSSGDVSLQEIRPNVWPAKDIVRLARLIAQRQIDETGSLSPLDPQHREVLTDSLKDKYSEYFEHALAK